MIDYSQFPLAKPERIKRARARERKRRNEIRRAWRAAILARANGRCEHCHRADTRLEVHHIIFRSQGGWDTLDNGTAVCARDSGCQAHRRLHSLVLPPLYCRWNPRAGKPQFSDEPI